MQRHFRAKSGGFTLLELLIVLSIIGIAAAFLLPRLSSSDGARVQAEVRELVSVLNYARRMALIQGQETLVRLYPPVADTAEANSADSRRNQPGQWFSRGVEISAKGAKQARGNEPFEVHFYPGGGSNGGDYELKHGSLSVQVQIDALTGKLKATLDDEKKT